MSKGGFHMMSCRYVNTTQCLYAVNEESIVSSQLQEA